MRPAAWCSRRSRTPTSTRRSPGGTGSTCRCTTSRASRRTATRSTYAREHPDAPWIFGGGWLMAHFPGGTPTKELLDDVVPDRPVFLLNRDVHGAWVNSKALELGHVTARRPTRGTAGSSATRHRRADGHPPRGRRLLVRGRPSPCAIRDEWERAILLAQAHLHSLGIAGWQDAWVTPATERVPLARRARRAHGPRRGGALVGPAPRRRPGRGAGRPPRPRLRRHLPPDRGEDHVRRRAREPHGAMLRPYCDAAGHETDERGLAYVDTISSSRR